MYIKVYWRIIFMENFDGLNFRKFEENDVNLFKQMFKNVFDKDSQMHLGENCGPDGYEDGDFLKKWYLHKDVTSYAIFSENTPIEGIALWINKNMMYTRTSHNSSYVPFYPNFWLK